MFTVFGDCETKTSLEKYIGTQRRMYYVDRLVHIITVVCTSVRVRVLYGNEKIDFEVDPPYGNDI